MVKKLRRDVRKRFSERSRFRMIREELRKDKEVLSYLSGSAKNEILILKVRNKAFIDKYNPREVLDSITKLEFKQRLFRVGVPTPDTLMVLSDPNELESNALKEFLMYWAANGGFVVKPSRSCGGKGIVLIRTRVGKRLITLRGFGMESDALIRFFNRILAGKFSRAKKDVAIIEKRVIPHRALRDLYTTGVLDIRIMVFLGYPVMAMTRLPTRASGGRANLHRGAIGAGIRLSTGKIIHAVHRGRSIERHVDTNRHLIGFKFPFWREILELATRAQLISGLGYAGVDIVIDEKRGPLILEVNKRPGLEIQNANKQGLLRRLRWIEMQDRSNSSNSKTPKWSSLSGEGIERKIHDHVTAVMTWDKNGWR